MPDEIKKAHGVMVVLTTQVEFIAHTPGINGGEPKNKRCAALQFQGGGVVLPTAWDDATKNDKRGEVVQELLKQAIERLPAEIVAAFADCGQKAYDGEEPSRLITPNMQQAVAASGAQLRKVKPS